MLSRFLWLLWVPVVMIACVVFSSERAEAEEALASWYGPGFSGLPTASGEPYDPYGLTAAHKTMPLGTELLVSYGGSSVEVTVNDRGPYVGARELDLSQGAAQVLGFTEAGVDYVDYTWTDPYAAVPQTASTSSPYASTPQEPYDASASVSQYSVEDETIVGHQYASVEQYPQLEEAPVGSEAVSAVPPTAPSTGAVVGDVGGSVLVVAPGETLSSIAAETGVAEDYLASQNGIGDPNFVYAGQVLYY